MISIDSASVALVFFCVIQLVTTLQRLVFDFLGFQYSLILFNFLNLIFALFGVFGSFQRRILFIVSHVVWNLVYITFNIFVICFYLEIGSLRREQSWVLSFVGSVKTWWFDSLCGAIVAENLTELSSPYDSNLVLDGRKFTKVVPTTTQLIIPRSDQVSIDCIFPFYWVEVLQASVQVLLAFCSFVCGVCSATRLQNFNDSASRLASNLYDGRDRFTFEQAQIFKGRRSNVIDALSVESFATDGAQGGLNSRQRMQNYVAPVPVGQMNGTANGNINMPDSQDRHPLVTAQPTVPPGFASSTWLQQPPIGEAVNLQVSPHTTVTSTTVRSVDSFRMAISGSEQPANSENIPMRSFNNSNGHFYQRNQPQIDVNIRPSPYVFIPPAR